MSNQTYVVGESGKEIVVGKAVLPTKPSFLKDVVKGAMNVAKVLWQVPAARGFIATLLVRFGVPGTLLAIGMAVGDKVLGN